MSGVQCGMQGRTVKKNRECLQMFTQSLIYKGGQGTKKPLGSPFHQQTVANICAF